MVDVMGKAGNKTRGAATGSSANRTGGSTGAWNRPGGGGRTASSANRRDGGRTGSSGGNGRTGSGGGRNAAARASAGRGRSRRTVLLAGGSITAVLAIVIAIVAVKLTRTPAHAAPAVADSAVAREVSSIPAATFNAVKAGTATGLQPIGGQPELTMGGKPELLYMGGQFCPYCAAERWAIAAAVSRFGTLSGLRFIHSSPTDAYPSTPTLSFDKARYTSRYLGFVPVEWFSERPDPRTPFGYAYLQHPTAPQLALFAKYAGGSVPFVDIANRYLVPTAQYIPSALANLSWAQVAAAMQVPSSPVGKDIDGAANMITAAICTLTHGKPVNVCRSAGVRALYASP